MWLEQNGCPGRVASVGLKSDFRYLPVLAGIAYAGDFSKPPGEILLGSVYLDFRCVAVSTSSEYFPYFSTNQAFEEKYRNNVVVIYYIRS